MWWGMVFLINLLGSLNPRIDKLREDAAEYFAGWLFRFLVLFPISFVIFYWIMPAMVGPTAGFIKVLWPLWVINILGTLALMSEETGGVDKEKVGGTLIASLFLVLVGIFTVIVVLPYKWANVNSLHVLVEVAEAAELEEVDTLHIRQVSKEMAEWRGNQIIGKDKNYGAQFVVGNYSIQRVNNELYWVAPLEFRSIAKWISADTSPGFIMVSAEDPTKEARLVTGFKMLYMMNSYFSYNIVRHVYDSYMFCRITEFTFEVTDNLKPKWVISVLKPTVGWTGNKMQCILIVDPETGAIEEYDIDKVPEWVDRVIPEDICETYNAYWGAYPHGWVNSWWGEEDVTIPTEFGLSAEDTAPDVWLTYGNDGEPYWFTGHTSASSADMSLVGFTMMNSRTGKMKFFKMTGANENAVLTAVNNAVSNFEGWHGTQPILYNIYGEKAWVVPVVGRNNTFQRIAITQASTSLVVLGETKEKALIKFRQLITKGKHIAPTASAYERKAEGEIARINEIVEDGNTIFYIRLSNVPEKLFTGAVNISPELAIAQQGDKAVLGFLETTEEVVPLSSFDIPAITLQKSKTQEEFEKLEEKRDVKEEDNWDKQEELRKELRKLQGE